MRLWNDSTLKLNLTRLGAEYVLALLCVGAFAVNSGNNLLYLVFGLMLALFLVSGWVSRSALRGIRLLRVEEGNLFARVRGGLRLRLLDRFPKRVRGLEVHLWMDEGEMEPTFHPGGAPGESEPVVVVQALPFRRGWHRLVALEFRTAYPFGFLEKTRRYALDEPVLVLPHPRTPKVRRLGELPEGRPLRPVPGEGTPEGSRPLRPGDPPGRVHWKRTAQRRTPWVRTFHDETTQGLRLRLDLRDWTPGEPFEKELERLSGEILQARLQRQEVTLEVRGYEGTHEVAGPRDCWRMLALAQAEKAA